MDTKAVLDMLKVVWPVVVLNYALVIWALVDPFGGNVSLLCPNCFGELL